jgi:hypothetical protein
MNGCWDCSPGGWAICILWAIGWWLIASWLLLLSWNRVIAAIASVKKVQYWHVLLIVLTLAVISAPLCCGGDRGENQWGCHQDGKDCCEKRGHKARQCGGCEDWKTPADSSGHPER